MTLSPVIIIGAGGHAAVVADALLQTGRRVIGFVESASCWQARSMCGIPVYEEIEYLATHNCNDVELVNGIGGIGDASQRMRVQQRLQADGWQFTGIIHPSAEVSPFSAIAADAQILARAVIHPYAKVNHGCIVNTGVIIEHHVSLGPWTHAAPGSVICGNAQLGEGCHVGAGAVLIQGIELGACTLVGAGACVTRSFQGNGTLVGVPAKNWGCK